MQLLDIKITPIEYEIHIEQGKLVPVDSVEADSFEDCSKSTHSKSVGNVNVRMDTLAVNTSPQSSVQSLTQVETISPANTAYAVYRENDNGGTVDAQNLKKMVNIDFIDKRMVTIDSQMNLSPQIKIDPSWEPASDVSRSDSSSESTSVDFLYNERSKIEYVPGRFHMDIIQYPKVEFEYIGGFNYVPKSSDPDYEGEE